MKSVFTVRSFPHSDNNQRRAVSVVYLNLIVKLFAQEISNS
jgi:hypothetical protein